MLNVGVVGYGYWGPNLVRNFWDVPGVRLVSVCDLRSPIGWRGQTPLSGGRDHERTSTSCSRIRESTRSHRHAGLEPFRARARAR